MQVIYIELLLKTVLQCLLFLPLIWVSRQGRRGRVAHKYSWGERRKFDWVLLLGGGGSLIELVLRLLSSYELPKDLCMPGQISQRHFHLVGLMIAKIMNAFLHLICSPMAQKEKFKPRCMCIMSSKVQGIWPKLLHLYSFCRSKSYWLIKRTKSLF